ncbi:Bacterial type II secretion system protein F domain protein [compost metagenome]
MIFVIVFISLIVLGLLQCYNLFVLQQRTKVLRKAELIGLTKEKKSIKAVLRTFPRVYHTLKELQFHLIGKTRSVWMKTVTVCIVLQGVIFYVNHEFLHLKVTTILPLGLVFTVVGVYVNNKKKSRVTFERDFAEALNIINSSIRAGNSIVRGICECGGKLTGQLGEEFNNIAQRLEIGESANSVFAESFNRFPYKEYYFFILTVQLNMKGGGQVKEVMNKLTSLISNGRIIDRKKISMTSEVRMSVKILAAIPTLFIIFMKFSSPQNFDILLYHPTGQIIFYYSVGSILLGLFIVWLMMNKI